MNHLAIATLELTVDEPNYEKALKTFSHYANLQRFKERVVSGQPLQILKGGNQGARATIYPTRPTYTSEYCPKFSRTERELFKDFIQRLK